MKNSSYPMSYKKSVLILLSVFLITFVPRIIGLGTMIVADEQLWVWRSITFIKSILNADLLGTSISGHPGVMTMWLTAISTGIAFLAYGYKELSDLLFPGQLTIAITTYLAIILTYFLIKELFNERIAIISLILIALDPFYLAFSRIIHLDALMTSFMTLSFLSFLIYMTKSKRLRFLVSSGVFAGLGILTKIPAVFLFPIVASIVFSGFLHDLVTGDSSVAKLLKEHLLTCVIWSLTTFGVIFILWPALWVDPVLFLKLFMKAPGMVAHEHGQFFMGAPVNDPGYLYYPVVILLRMSPLTLVFSLIYFFYVLFYFTKYPKSWGGIEKDAVFLIIYIFLFVVFMSLGAKKVGRYILPVFPILDIIAALGIFITFDRLTKKFAKQSRVKICFSVLVFIVLITQIIPIIRLHPYYLSYYNPLVGGPCIAQEAILIGRGEGMALVAEYLNRKEDPENITVASEFAYLLRVQFKGKVKSTKIEEYEPNTLNEVDYLVVYISGLQKRTLRIPNEVLQYHNTHEPEHTVRINGINYAYIYKI